MNDRIKQLALDAGIHFEEGKANRIHYVNTTTLEQFAELLLGNLADELIAVAQGSKKANPEWANGVNHAAMLAQRMTMTLPQWPEAE